MLPFGYSWFFATRSAIAYHVEQVPPILVAMVSNPLLFEMFDLSSITTIVSGSAPLDKSLADRVHALQPKWRILGAYGMDHSLRSSAARFCGSVLCRGESC